MFFKGFEKAVFWSLKLLTALLGSSCCFLGKSGAKMGFQNGYQKCEKKYQKIEKTGFQKIPAIPYEEIALTQIWGPSKPSYFEDVPKMASRLPKIAQKRSQNDPKMDQDCFQLLKIAPKTAQDSPKWVHKGSQNDPKLVRECLKLPEIYNNFHTRADNDNIFRS